MKLYFRLDTMTSLNDTIFDDVDGQNIDQDQEFPLKVTVSTALACKLASSMQCLPLLQSYSKSVS